MICVLSRWARLLCLLPFVAGSLLPVGFMPAVSSDGMLTLVICTPDGALEKSFPASNNETEHAAEWCPFSQLSAPALAPRPIQIGERHAFSKTNVDVSDYDVLAHVDVAHPQPRGPPTTL